MAYTDSYQLETGLKQSFDLTIDDASFQFDAGYNNGQTLCLILEGTDGDGDAQRLLYSTSPGWAPADGGARAEREDGAQNRTFNQNSAVGGLILAALQVGAPLRERGPATSASVWKGLSFRFERRKVNEGTQFETTRALPAAFLGAGSTTGASAAAPAAAAPAAAAAAPAAAAPANGANGGGGAPGLDALTSAKLKAIAKRAASHDAFIEEGLALAETNPAVEAVLADPAWYEAARA